jgi:hypothetical protein
VLVQVLPRTDAEEESAWKHRGCGGRRLGDDGRMQANRRARHPGADAEALRRHGNRAEHTPHEGALPLAIDPRMEVVGDQSEGEASVLRQARMLDEVERTVLLARE